jgi:hypothetical protein
VRGTSRKKRHTSDQGASKARNKEKVRKRITWARKKKNSLNPIAIGAFPSSFLFGLRTDRHDKDPHSNSTSSNALEKSTRLRASVWVCRSLPWRNVEARVRWATVVDVVLVVVHDLAVADLVVVVAAAPSATVVDVAVVGATVAAAPPQTAEALLDLSTWPPTGRPAVGRPMVELESGSFWDLGLVELGLAIHDELPRASAIIARFAGGEVQLLLTDCPWSLPLCHIFLRTQDSLAATISYDLRALESLRVWFAREDAPWYRDLRLWLATEDAT